MHTTASISFIEIALQQRRAAVTALKEDMAAFVPKPISAFEGRARFLAPPLRS